MIFAKLRRTHTRVHSPSAAQQERMQGEARAHHALACVQMAAQMILWVTFFGYDRAAQAVWQAAAAQGIFLIAACLVWKKVSFHVEKGRWIALLLIPCLMLDAAFAMLALSGFIGQVIPQYPSWVGVIVPGAACLFTAVSAGRRGAAYGADVLKGLLLVLFVCATLFLRDSSRADRLCPILGLGIGNTALAALNGSGSLWGAALLYLPNGQPQGKAKTAPWAVTAWLMGCIWALWHGFMRPWSVGDDIAVAEKMMGLARHASSVTMYEIAGVLWMLLLPLSITGSLTAGGRIIRRAWPKLPRFAAMAAILLPSLALLWFPAETLRLLETLLPWRMALGLLTGAGMLILSRKEAKR